MYREKTRDYAASKPQTGPEIVSIRKLKWSNASSRARVVPTRQRVILGPLDTDLIPRAKGFSDHSDTPFTGRSLSAVRTVPGEAYIKLDPLPQQGVIGATPTPREAVQCKEILICDQRDLRSAQAAMLGVYTMIHRGQVKFLSSLVVLRCSSTADYSEGQRIIHIEGLR